MRTSAPVRFVTPLAFALALVSAAAFADVVIPSSAFSNGQNFAEFHSDVRVFNPTNAPVNVTPVFYNQANGQIVAAPAPGTVTVPARGQVAFDNVLASLFLQAKGAFGPIRFETAAPIVVSSSVNNVNACGNGATSGQWLPGIDVGQALKAGTLLQLAASADGGSGYRSNVVFMNPGAATANVTTSLRKGDGTLVATFTLDPLPANGFKQIGTLSAWLPSPNTITDTNLWLEFTSDQPVLAFASVINNASGDPFAIVMTAEPNTATGPPSTNYTISPTNPQTNQTVVFTDTSTGGVVNRFWVFGDGTTKVGADPVATKTYTAAGTYQTWLFVDNAFGANSTTKNVIVAAAGPTAISIVATTTDGTKWTYTPNNVDLRVSQPYVITWSTPASEGKTHGIGGLAVLGIAQTDTITSNRPYVVNFTPTANMVGVWTYACTVTQCAPTQAVHDSMTGTLTIVP
jgi:PKD repeat protein